MKINLSRATVWGAGALLAVLFVVGCSPETPAAEPPVQEQATVQQESALLPSPAPTEPAPSPPTAVPVDPTAEPAATVEEEPTVAAADPTAEPVVEIETAVEATAAVPLFGRTAEGALFRGRADAPVTIIDYSDFL